MTANRYITARAASSKVPIVYAAPGRFQCVIVRASKVTGYTIAELTGAARFAELCHIRWAIMLNMRRRGLSFPVIGRILGGRDHSTVMHGVKRAEGLLAADNADFAALLDLIDVQ